LKTLKRMSTSTTHQNERKPERMSTSEIENFEVDVDIHNAPKQKKKLKRMSTSASQWVETDLDIRNGKLN